MRFALFSILAAALLPACAAADVGGPLTPEEFQTVSYTVVTTEQSIADCVKERSAKLANQHADLTREHLKTFPKDQVEMKDGEVLLMARKLSAMILLKQAQTACEVS